MTELFLSNLWRWKCGLEEKEPTLGTSPTLDSLADTEWSDEFEQLMRNRLVLGAFRYGLLGSTGKPTYKRVEDMIRRLEAYRYDLNKEHLVDVANLCLCEFVEGVGHLTPVDDGQHVPHE